MKLEELLESKEVNAILEKNLKEVEEAMHNAMVNIIIELQEKGQLK